MYNLIWLLAVYVAFVFSLAIGLGVVIEIYKLLDNTIWFPIYLNRIRRLRREVVARLIASTKRSNRMPEVHISRAGKVAPRLVRSDVKPGEVFAKVIDGKVSNKRYASIGHNGKFYSVNTNNGELATTAKAEGAVAIVGRFTYSLSKFADPRQYRQTTRDLVKNGELFVVKGGDNLYMHLGRLNSGKYMSANANSPINDAASTLNGRSAVTVVGTFSLKVDLAV